MSLLRIVSIPELRDLILRDLPSHADIVRLSRCSRAFRWLLLPILAALHKKREAAIRLQWWWRQFGSPLDTLGKFTWIMGPFSSGKTLLRINLSRQFAAQDRILRQWDVHDTYMLIDDGERVPFLRGELSLMVDCFSVRSIPQDLVSHCDTILLCGVPSADMGHLSATFGRDTPPFVALRASGNYDPKKVAALCGGIPFPVLEVSLPKAAWTLYDMTRHPAYRYRSHDAMVFPDSRWNHRPRMLARGSLRL